MAVFCKPLRTRNPCTIHLAGIRLLREFNLTYGEHRPRGLSLIKHSVMLDSHPLIPNRPIPNSPIPNSSGVVDQASPQGDVLAASPAIYWLDRRRLCREPGTPVGGIKPSGLLGGVATVREEI